MTLVRWMCVPRARTRSREGENSQYSVPIASLPCEYVTFSFFSSGCRSPSLPSPMPNNGETNSLARHDGHSSLLLFDRTAPGASMTRMTKYEFSLPSPCRPRRRANAEGKSWACAGTHSFPIKRGRALCALEA